MEITFRGGETDSKQVNKQINKTDKDGGNCYKENEVDGVESVWFQL